MRLALGLVVVAGLIALAGCGGGGERAASIPTATTSTAPTEHEVRQVALKRYLAQSRVVWGFYMRARSQADRAVAAAAGKYDGDPAEASSAALLRTATTGMSEASIRQRLTKPPKALKAINRRFAREMGERAAYYEDLASALDAAEGTDSYNALLASTGRDPDARTDWRLEVTAYARRIGVPMPKWAQQVGRVAAPS